MPPVAARRGFGEAMAMSRLPDSSAPLPVPDSSSSSSAASSASTTTTTRRFISHTPAWKPGQDLPKDPAGTFVVKQCYGGHVYIQAALAAARVVEEKDGASSKDPARRLGIHSIQGVFSVGGLSDRPFVYDVTEISSSTSFSTQLTTARQPSSPSSNPSGPFPASDAALSLSPDPAFTCITTFKRPDASSAVDIQQVSPWQRFAHVLAQRPPDAWPASPQVDLDYFVDLPGAAAVGQGTFPILDLHKVDMTAYNADKPLPERRELVLYRLAKKPRGGPGSDTRLDSGSDSGPVPATDPHPADVNAHVLCHAFEADRNGLLMLERHLGWGYTPGRVVSLSYAFFVHANAHETVMVEDEWWLQEASWPRASAGRGMMECRIWSPDGRHVATGYQDGLCRPVRGKI